MFVIVCDGGKRGALSYGSYKIFDEAWRLIQHNQMAFGNITSNHAEYRIVSKALEKALELGLKDVTVKSDSLQLISDVNKKRPIDKKYLRDELKYIISLKVQFNRCYFKKIHNQQVKRILGH